MQDGDGVPGGLQAPGDLVRPVLGAAEHEHALEVGFFKQGDQQVEFLRPGDGIERVVHGLVDGAVDAAFDALGVPQRERGDGGDLGRHGRGEEQRLAVLRAAGDDVLHDGQEAHVEHAVHFIEDEDLDRVEREFAAFDEVNEAAGRGRDHIDAFFEFAALVSVADTAEKGHGAEVREAGEIAEGGLDLRGEFAGGLEDEHAGGAAAGA